MADIVVIDDQDRTVELCRRVMPEHQWHGPARDWGEAQQLLRTLKRRVQLVLLDQHFERPVERLIGVDEGADEMQVALAQRSQGSRILAELRKGWPELPVILMTARAGGLEDTADQHSAEEYTYFLNDEDLDAQSLRAQVTGILRVGPTDSDRGPVFWGSSRQMRQIRKRLSMLARGRLPVIIGGPTGSGKSLIARHFLHRRSGREGRFVSVDLSTVPRDLVAAHLFGSVRGAYTGAIGDRAGAFEDAHGGTLFLDEVGHLTEDLQRMLLTVLQENEVIRVGATRPTKVNVKLVVASNEDLSQLVREGRFRRDLYMRLNPGATVVLPSLAQRSGDIEGLTEFCVHQSAAQPVVRDLLRAYIGHRGASGASADPTVVVCRSGEAKKKQRADVSVVFPDRTMRLLRQHVWSGNLREFSMTIENVFTLALAETLDAMRPSGAAVGSEGPLRLQIRPKLLRDLLMSVDPPSSAAPDGWSIEVGIRAGNTLNKVAQDVERQYFTALYVETRGDFSAMASVLLGDAEGGRKVQLRFNQLGLRVRELKASLP